MNSDNKLQHKVPPQNLEAEISLLGSLMIDKNAIVKVADFLRPRDFYKQSHREIYETMVGLFDRREPIDMLSISASLKEKGVFDRIGGNACLTEMINSVPTASHVLNYAKIVQKKRILRDLIESSREIEDMAYKEIGEVDSLLDHAEKKIFGIAEHSMQQRFYSIRDNLEETFERIDKLSKFKGSIRGVPTGFTALDNMLSGLQKSDLVILAARPSLGKSSLAFNIALNASMNHKVPVGIFSLEMSKDQIIDRFISTLAEIDLWKLRTGKLSSEGDDNDFQRIQRALAGLAETRIYVDDSSTSDVLQMRAMTRRLQADKGLGLIIVDYLQLIDSSRISTYDSMVQQMSVISRSLKGLAKELNVPVLALSQLSRAVEQRTPQIPRLSDLRESGCLTGDSLIHRSDTGELVAIKDLVGNTDVPIYSMDENYRVTESRMSKIFSTGKKMVYRLKTRSGNEIKASANHPFWKISGWTRLDELKAGDHIATPKKLEISKPKNEMSDDEIVLLAHLLGDGCILPKQPYHYTSSDKKNIEAVKSAAGRLFDIKPRTIRQKNWWHVYLPSPYPLARGKRHPITNWFNSLKIERVRSFDKTIPQKVFSLSDEKLALFLRHLWATDGHVGIKKIKNKKPAGSVYYATTSKEMANAIKYLLLRFGIRSRIGKTVKQDYRACYHVTIMGSAHQRTFFEEIGCFGQRGEMIPEIVDLLKKIKTNTNLDVWPKGTWKHIIDPLRRDKNVTWRELSSKIDTAYSGNSLFKSGIGTMRMEKMARCLQSPILFDMAKADIFWDEIVSIEPLGVEEVYDATVPGLHNFVANGIIVENSIEQDADVVLFIHREDKYRGESERKNIADIMVAKHRNGPVGKVELYFDEQTATFKNLERNYDEGSDL